MTHFFSPHTGEIIITDAPADWMLQTDVKPPKYDPATHGCFWRDGAWEIVPAATPTIDEIKNEFLAAVQAHIDGVARQKGYDSGVSLASYATDTHPPFAAEANAFIQWRSSVWLYCYQQFEKVINGTRTVTTTAEFIQELPEVAWP